MKTANKNASLSRNARVPRRAVLAGVALLVAGVGWQAMPGRAGEAAVFVPPLIDTAAPAASIVTSDTAVLAGGCFWGVQGVFQHVVGVTRAVSGYAGGDARAANYDAVGSGRSGHAEAVRISFDPRQVSFAQLLQIYFSVAHDPTQLNRQGPDTGTQYRSAIFFTTPEQQKIALAYVAQLQAAKVYPKPIVTQVTPLQAFYQAEEYHLDYLARNPRQPYIVFNDLPKLAALKKEFPELYRGK